jgi:WD40 repeat protein
LSADGRLAVSASEDYTIKVWEIQTERELYTLTVRSDDINSVAVSSDGRLAISASYSNPLRVWEVSTGGELYALAGHSSDVNSLAMSANGRLAVSVSEDKTIKLWDTQTGGCLATLPVGVPLTCCAISMDEKTIVVGDINGIVHFLELVGVDKI